MFSFALGRVQVSSLDNLHNSAVTLTKSLKSLKSPRRRKFISARCFYVFLLPNILLEEIKRSFQRSGLELSNINQESKSNFNQFQKAVQ